MGLTVVQIGTHLPASPPSTDSLPTPIEELRCNRTSLDILSEAFAHLAAFFEFPLLDRRYINHG